MYPIIRVDSRNAESLEPLGSKRKFWFRRDEPARLLKLEERGTGEDWAKKIACELCTLMGLPHVHYELAWDDAGDTPGVLCETCSPPPVRMGLGNQFLQAIDPTYPEGTKYHVHQHTVDAVSQVVRVLAAPPPARYCIGLPAGIATAIDVFVGYIMLDAWIANQDRHDQNWGALLIDGQVHLAPTFDHGASLARNLSDAERAERLGSKDGGRRIPRFARRARSAFYSDAAQQRPMTTFDAWRAFSLKAPEASRIWLDQLRRVDEDAMHRILNEVPPQRMSEVSRRFTMELLLENQRRLLGGED